MCKNQNKMNFLSENIFLLGDLYVVENLTLFLWEFWQDLKKSDFLRGRSLYLGSSYPGNTVLKK
jgi:hypothetical protein